MCIHHNSFWNKQDKKSLSTVVFVLNCCTSFDVRRLSLMSARRDLNICLSGNLKDLTALQGSEGWPCQLWKTKSQTNSSLLLFLPMPSSPCPESFSNIPCECIVVIPTYRAKLLESSSKETQVLVMSPCSKREHWRRWPQRFIEKLQRFIEKLLLCAKCCVKLRKICSLPF